MANNQKVNAQASYTVETEDQGNNVHRQVVKVGNAISATAEPLTASATVTEGASTITSSAANVLAANATRKGGYIQNISDSTIWVSFGGTAVADACTEVISNATLPLTITGVIWRGAVSAISPAGNKDVIVVEV